MWATSWTLNRTAEWAPALSEGMRLSDDLREWSPAPLSFHVKLYAADFAACQMSVAPNLTAGLERLFYKNGSLLLSDYFAARAPPGAARHATATAPIHCVHKPKAKPFPLTCHCTP